MHGEHLVYLYCVAAQPPDPNEIQDTSGGLYLVREAGLCAVVSQVPVAEFGVPGLRRNLEDLTWVAAETTRHERIVEMVCRDRCVIPFRFATLFSADENLRVLLRAHSEVFMTLLHRLDNKAEWGVKVYCDTEKLGDHICAEDSTISGLDKTIGSASSGKAFLLRKKRDELAKAALAGRADQYAEQVVETLREVSSQTRINKVLPPGATDRRDPMILNAAFLVGNEDTLRFQDAVTALNAGYAEDGVAIECSGPWPPYNFCDLSRKVMDE